MNYFNLKSKVGMSPINLNGVSINILENTIECKKNNMILVVKKLNGLIFNIQDSILYILPESENTNVAFWGTQTRLLLNAVNGLNTPFQKILILSGMGYSVALEKQNGVNYLKFTVGYTKPQYVEIPTIITAELLGTAKVKLTSICKCTLNNFAAFCCNGVTKLNSYKLKGIMDTEKVYYKKERKG